VQSLADSRAACLGFNSEKDALVHSEKMFNLDISKFPELIAMEQANETYTKIYSIYEQHRAMIKEHSTLPW